MEIKISSDNVPIFTFEFANSNKDEYNVLLLSDLHIDSKYCDKFLLEQVLGRAKENGWVIFILGDLFDAMQGRNDPRHSKLSLKNREIKEAYFNSIVDEVADFLEPYKECVGLIGYGNHETSVLHKNEIDLIRLLVNKLGANIVIGGYEGFVLFRLWSYRAREKRVLYYNHGRSNNAVVTLGTIEHNRLQNWLPNADVIVTGHSHSQLYFERKIYDVTNAGTVKEKTITHLKIPTFLNRDFGLSYSARLQAPPPPKGGWLLSFKFDSRHVHKPHLDPFPLSISFVRS